MRSTRPISWLLLITALGAGPATQRTEKTTYLGVVTTVAPPALQEQLGLSGGVGVVIEYVEPDSPADHAGLSLHDVVVGFDDQVVVNVQQFGVLVRMRHGGDTARVSVIRRGRPTTLPVKLAERLMPAQPTAEDVRVPLPPHGGRLSSIVRHTDPQHTIVLTTHGDDRHVRVADADGNTLYDGPLNTPEDAARLPADCRAKVETVQRNFELFKSLRVPATTLPSAK